MKGRAKLLDSGFREFIEYLQKMGELHNILRMIDSFYGMNGMDCSELDTGHYNVEKGGFTIRPNVPYIKVSLPTNSSIGGTDGASG